MVRKRVLALVMMMAFVGAGCWSGGITLKAEAAGLTQATDPTQVQRRQLTADEINTLRTLFDADYYLEQNPQLAEKVGTDYASLFNHFITCGIFEGYPFNSDFDPSAYLSAYGDVQAACGFDVIKICTHFVNEGQALGYDITTLEKCADAGITVTSVINQKVQITPQIFNIAKRIGTTDVIALATSIERAAIKASDSGSSVAIQVVAENAQEAIADEANDVPVAPVIVAPEDEGMESRLEELGYNPVGTVTVGGDVLTLYVVRGSEGYGAYSNIFDEEWNSVVTLEAQTEGYEPAEEDISFEYIWYNTVALIQVGAGEIGEQIGVAAGVVKEGETNIEIEEDEEVLEVLIPATVLEEEQVAVDENHTVPLEQGSVYFGNMLLIADTTGYVDTEATEDSEFDVGISLDMDGDDLIIGLGIVNEDTDFENQTQYTYENVDEAAEINIEAIEGGGRD